MGISVNPEKMDELAAEFNRLKSTIEDGETGMNKEIKNLITSVNSKYSESSVRNVTSEMDETLKEIRNHAKIITEMLMEKEKALIKGAELIRQEELQMRNKINNLKMGTTMRHPILKGPLGNAFTTIGGVGTNLEENNNLEFLQGKGKNKYLSYYYVTDPKTGKRVTAQEMIKIIEKREKEKNYSSSYYVTDPVTGEQVLVEEMYRRIKERENEVNEGSSKVDWIPDVMQLDGTSEAEQYLASRINSLNSRISNQDLKWNQDKINQIWDTSQLIYGEYGIQVDPRLLLAIIFQEGTGSFNTSATNLAADGQHGVETDFAKDLMKANNLIFGKIIGYAYYGRDFNQSVVSNNDKPGISGNGKFFQYANWNTPIIDLDRGNVRYGVYAGHGDWHEGVGGMYEKLSYDGASLQYSAYLSGVNKETILNITNGISLPNVVFTPSQTSQDYLGNPNGEYIIQGKATR